MHNLKSWLKNILLFIFSLTLVLLIGEWLFPKYLNKVPFRLYGGVKNELRILAQYSKHSVLPENYIAIVGDSNSDIEAGNKSGLIIINDDNSFTLYDWTQKFIKD